MKTKRVIIALFFDKLPHIQKSIFILKGIFFSLKLSKIIKYTSYHFCGFTPSWSYFRHYVTEEPMIHIPR